MCHKSCLYKNVSLAITSHYWPCYASQPFQSAGHVVIIKLFFQNLMKSFLVGGGLSFWNLIMPMPVMTITHAHYISPTPCFRFSQSYHSWALMQRCMVYRNLCSCLNQVLYMNLYTFTCLEQIHVWSFTLLAWTRVLYKNPYTCLDEVWGLRYFLVIRYL